MRSLLRKIIERFKGSNSSQPNHYENDLDNYDEDTGDLINEDDVVASVKINRSAKSRFSFSSFAHDLQHMQWETIINWIFSPGSRGRVHRWFVIFGVIGGTYATGKIIALTIRKPGQEPQARKAVVISPPEKEDVRPIQTANLFNTKSDGEKKPSKNRNYDDKIICKDASKVSTLPIQLINTIVLQDTIKSIASVQKRGDRGLQDYREGEKVGSIAEISRIERLRVVIKNLQNGECEYLENENNKRANKSFEDKKSRILSPRAGRKLIDSKKPDGLTNEGNHFTIKKSLRDEILGGDVTEVFSQALATPIQNPDGSISFKISDVVPGSIYSHLDIQDGDIITTINGKKIKDQVEILNMFSNIKNIDQLSIGIDRGGVEETKEYEFD